MENRKKIENSGIIYFVIQATIRYFALEQNIFFSKFKIDKYEFITKIGKIEKVKKNKIL